MIKTSRLKGPYTIHYLGDPAIDQAHADYNPVAYATTFDLRHLPLTSETAKLSAFDCEPLTLKQAARVEALKSINETQGLIEAVAYALRGARDYDEAGGALPVKRVRDDHDGQRLSKETLERLYNDGGLDLLQVLGQLVLNRSHLNPLS